MIFHHVPHILLMWLGLSGHLTAVLHRKVTTVFVDTRKRFQNFCQYMLSTDRIEIHQSQPSSMTKRRSEDHTSGCDWWISIRSVGDSTQDRRKFWKRFRGCFVFQSRVSTKTVVRWNPIAFLPRAK